jgi:hypothetical protein
MKIGRMCLARVKGDDNALMLEIGLYVFHSSNFLQNRAKFAHTFIAIFAFGRDLDGFQDRVISAFREKRISWIRIVRSCGVHRSSYFPLINVPHSRNGRLVRDRFD